MTNTEYLSTLVSSLPFVPTTLQEALRLKADLYVDHLELDTAVDVIITQKKAEAVEDRVDEERREGFKRAYQLMERRNND